MPGLIAASIALTLACMIANAGHLATATQMLADIMAWYFTGTTKFPPLLPEHRAVALLFLGTLVMPLCASATQLNGLRHVSTCSASTVLILAISMIIVGAGQIANSPPPSSMQVPAFVWDTETLLGAAGAICFAYSSIVNIVGVYREMQPVRTVSGARNAAATSTLICGSLYFAMALICAFAWGTTLFVGGGGNVLYAIPPSNYWVTFWCWIFVICMILMYSVINLPMVRCGETLLVLALTSELPDTPHNAPRMKELTENSFFCKTYSFIIRH